MYLIVGLGNPENEYNGTRHNMGFDAVNIISKETGIQINKKGFKSIYGVGEIENEKVILVKPQTYMNLSGEAVSQIRNFYKIENNKIIVIYDDIDLEIGEIRIRNHGSSGTHNGMKSVVENLATNEFPRVRVGIGKPDNSSDLINYVIGKIPKEERDKLEKCVQLAAEATINIVKYGITKAMNEFNGRKI